MKIIRGKREHAEAERADGVGGGTLGRRHVLGGLAALPVLYGVGSATPARAASAVRPGSVPTAGGDHVPTAAGDLMRGQERRYNAPLLTQQIRCLRMLKWLGRHEESGPGPHLRGGTDHCHVPGGRFVDLIAQCIGEAQYVEDGREPGVEHPVVHDERYFHDGTTIK